MVVWRDGDGGEGVPRGRSCPAGCLRCRMRRGLILTGQEALVNSFEHGRAEHVHVSLEIGEEALILKVKEDAQGGGAATLRLLLGEEVHG